MSDEVFTPYNYPVEDLFDSKGRRELRYMDREEKIDEILTTMRQTQDTVNAFIESFGTNPMFKSMARMFGGK